MSRWGSKTQTQYMNQSYTGCYGLGMVHPQINEFR